MDEAQQKFKNMNRVPSDLIVERAIKLGGQKNVQAVVLSCCDMPTLAAIPKIETELGKPVTSSTQSLFWRTMKAAKLPDQIKGRGLLFESS